MWYWCGHQAVKDPVNTVKARSGVRIADADRVRLGAHLASHMHRSQCGQARCQV
jgi:tetrahydrodipicolinate N-succinyltransferase